MSHFALIALAEPEWVSPTGLLEKRLTELLAPYDENLAVPEYERACGCDDARSCLACGGTGWERSTYNPESKWDWWVVGGRWDGELLAALKDLEPGEEALVVTDEPANALPLALLKTEELRPFAVLEPNGEWHEKGRMGFWTIVSDRKDEEEWKREQQVLYEQHADCWAVLVDCHIRRKKGGKTMKLNQILAIEKGLKSGAESRLTLLHQRLQKPDLLAGLSRTYQRRHEEDSELPPPNEQKHVQMRAEETLAEVREFLGGYWDVVAGKEATNQLAKADVVVDGKVLIKEAPVTLLLFLEKQLVNLTTYLEKLPVLDPGEVWQHDAATNAFVTAEKETIRSKKVPRAFVKTEATDKHPAQVDSYMEDVPVGTWKLKLSSGAIPEARRRLLVARVEGLSRAVKAAREAANVHEAVELKIGKVVFDFLFAKG